MARDFGGAADTALGGVLLSLTKPPGGRGVHAHIAHSAPFPGRAVTDSIPFAGYWGSG